MYGMVSVRSGECSHVNLKNDMTAYRVVANNIRDGPCHLCFLRMGWLLQKQRLHPIPVT